ncbi:hypothetical protein AAC387_Pa03g0832 [Persea americana]
MALQMLKETAISHIVQGALDKAWSCLQNGYELFLGAQNHLVKIRDSLKEIRDFIVIAEGSPIKDPKLMELLEKLKDAAYDAEDLLEEYEIADRRRSEEAENRTNKVRRVVNSLVTTTPVIMPIKLKELSERLEAIKAEGHTFQLEEKVTNLGTEVRERRETHPFVHESQVLGREDEKMEIVTSLLSTKLDHVSAIAIVGIGGLGKTTLAQSVFNDDAVQNYFDPKIWICVSDNLVPDNFDIKRLGNKILEGATRVHCNLSDLAELQRRLQEELGGKRFLLVLDDVWNEEPSKWHGTNGLRGLLLCGGKESRIVVTTRSEKVASIMSNIQTHSLNPLPKAACWSLFCRHAFGNPTEEAARSKLEPIGRQIVEKCKGNPLAVTTVGGLLQDKRSESRWKSVRDSEMWSLPEETEKGILPALRLSYNYLRPHLKQCFAICAIFPQDYKIEKDLVIKLWMAHGFIPTNQGMELEDIGNEIFDELVMRSFFQDVEENVKIYKPRRNGYGFLYDGTTFRMHDLMHDLAHSVMENEYRVVLNGKSKDISPRIRHVSSNGLGILAASLPKAQMLRTYVMLEQVASQFLPAAFQFPCDVGLFKCLRALDFMRQDKQVVEKQLLDSLGNLQHLRYLNLSDTLIEMLPESLTSLCFLQTLILIHCTMLCELPKEMSKLTNLRCLDISHCDKLNHMPPKMGQLSCLQELSNFIVGRTKEIACSGIGELQGLNLRGLLKIQLLKNITGAIIDVPRDTLINKPNLTSLDLMWESSTSRYVKFGDLEEDRVRGVLEKQVLQGLQPHRSLKKLGIFHYGGLNFSSWMMDTALTELVEIKLSGCWRCSHLPPLGELPFLKVLEIDGLKNVECIGNEFYGNEVSGGFPSLEELEICDMEKLKTWSGLEWKGGRVFPSLVELKIWSCPMLSTLEFFPDIKDLNVDQGMMQSLKKLKLMNISFCGQLQFFLMGPHNLTSFESMHQQNCNQSSFANEDQIRGQSSLQKLLIRNCNKLIFSGLGLRYLSSLKSLRINGSNEFVHVAHELSFLTNLQSLTLSRCHGLKSLPEGIGNLTSLQDLMIWSCDKLIFSSLGLRYLSSLKFLMIDGSNEFAHVAHELSFLTNLQYLWLGRCHGLKSLPEGIGNLTSLRVLNIHSCPEMASLPRELQCLSALNELVIYECPTLETRCMKDTGEDWDKIQHIPRISINGCDLIARD